MRVAHWAEGQVTECSAALRISSSSVGLECLQHSLSLFFLPVIDSFVLSNASMWWWPW